MKPATHRPKYIFVTGGVVSGLGKGVAIASIGALLENCGLKISITKFDPYINVDAGTMNPGQHGEVFVTNDGAETDLDLGHYERFTKSDATRENNHTTGQIYNAVIGKERRGDFLGATVQVIPHITDEICARIEHASHDVDIALIEIGGTVGDIESLPFLEAIRQFGFHHQREDILYIHVVLVPFLPTANEHKTKPSQHSVNKLREIGIQPDMLLCRCESTLDEHIRKKIALFTNVELDCVVANDSLSSPYLLPLRFHEAGLERRIMERLKMWTGRPNLSEWKSVETRLQSPQSKVRIAMVGKYGDREAYQSVREALIHGALGNFSEVDIQYVHAEALEDTAPAELLGGVDGILVPGGFDTRGVEGKIRAIEWARNEKVPFFGICLGMQAAVIEVARHLGGIEDANSSEFNPDSSAKVVDLLQGQKNLTEKGGSMRLGACVAVLEKDSKLARIYGKAEIAERHRHRYEINPKYVSKLVKWGLQCSGKSPDGVLVEAIELKDHPWFIGCQFHPEFVSKPFAPHPLFLNFIEAALAYQQLSNNENNINQDSISQNSANQSSVGQSNASQNSDTIQMELTQSQPTTNKAKPLQAGKNLS